MKLAVPLPTSPSGKVHRQCPLIDCVPRLFQLESTCPENSIPEQVQHLARRESKARGTTCPYCGHDDDDDKFVYPADRTATRELLTEALREDVHEHMQEIARDFNRRCGGGLIKLSMRVERSPRPRLRRPKREDLLREVRCDICCRAYGVYAIALFCPSCGARNVHVHFQRELDLLHRQLGFVDELRQRGENELAYRTLGDAHENVLTALETFFKTIYRFLVKRRLSNESAELCSDKAIGNSFQNIERGKKLFAKLGVDPFGSLDGCELETLGHNMQKRHLLTHNLSMVDERFREVTKCGQPGQTITIPAEEVSRFGELCKQIVVKLEEGCLEFLPADAAKLAAVSTRP